MSMMDATERTKPVMEYIRTLETKVRELRSREGRLSVTTFVVGVVVGVVVGGAMAWLMR